MKRRGGTGSKTVKNRPRKAAKRHARSPNTQTASQARIATLERQLAEALEQQGATTEVLKVISSSTGELAPVFESLLASAKHLCGAEFGIILLREGGAFRTVALHSATAAYAEARWRAPFIRPAADTGLGRVLETKQAVQIADVRAVAGYVDNPAQAPIVRLAGVRSKLSVPMLKEEDLIGVIEIDRQEVRPFTDKQIELVQNFAAQAVIVIENARLLSELRKSLQQQTASADVLKVISSSPTALEPVFESILTNAVSICGAKFGNLHLYQDGKFLTVAQHGAPPAYAELRRQDPAVNVTPGSSLDRVARTKQIVHIDDLAADPAHHGHAIVTLGAARTVLAMPMLKDGVLIGAIGIYRQEVRPFTDKQIDLVNNFAAQAVIAIENTRLLKELRQRTDDLSEALEQQTATSEVLRAISGSPGELRPVFDAMLANAVRICGAHFGNLLLYEGDSFRVAALHGAPPEWMELRRRQPVIRPGPHSPVRRAITTRKFQQVGDMRTEREYVEGEASIRALVDVAGARSFLAVPMLKDHDPVGTIGI